MRYANPAARTFNLDVETCPRCGGKMRLIALVQDAENIARYDWRLVGHGPDHHTGAVLVARGQLGSGDFAGEPPGYVPGSPSASARQRAT